MGAAYLFVAWAGGGNVNPFLGLAEGLLARGHRVRAVATGSLHDRLAAAGIEPVGAPDGWLPEAGDVLAAVDRDPPDALVVDYMLTGALCGAESSGRPTAALVHTLYRQLLVDGAPHPMGMAGSVDAVNEIRAAAGLPPVASYGELLEAADVVLVTAPRALDAPGEVPANVVYTGALFEGPGPDRGWRPPTGRGPLVVVSLGTAGDDPAAETAVLERIVRALGELPVRGLVTVPDSVDPARLALPGNVTVTGYVRHAAVLPHADLVVTHGGLGTVVAALAHGLRMVCLPLGREQPDNARAVARIGAGCQVAADAGIDELAAAVAGQLAEPEGVRLAPDPGRAVALMDELPTAASGPASVNGT